MEKPNDCLIIVIFIFSWFMAPNVVNAYYSQERNEVVFPAGVLQQPLYSPFYPK
jgi:predicted metalloendopeptidase